MLRTSATARVWWVHQVAKVRPNRVSLNTSLYPSDAVVDEVILGPEGAIKDGPLARTFLFDQDYPGSHLDIFDF